MEAVTLRLTSCTISPIRKKHLSDVPLFISQELSLNYIQFSKMACCFMCGTDMKQKGEGEGEQFIS